MGYTYVVRAIPLLLLIFWTYFAVPLITGVNISGFVTMLVALVVYEGAYLGEVVRAGINAVPKGQVEAARAIGMSYGQCMRKIVLPQALFNMLPSILNQFIMITKNTSLAYLIGHSGSDLRRLSNQQPATDSAIPGLCTPGRFLLRVVLLLESARQMAGRHHQSQAPGYCQRRR
jgi:ABC-type amino acid transport system permease subunit